MKVGRFMGLPAVYINVQSVVSFDFEQILTISKLVYVLLNEDLLYVPVRLLRQHCSFDVEKTK